MGLLRRGEGGRIAGRSDARRPETGVFVDGALVALHEVAASLGLDVAAVFSPNFREVRVAGSLASHAPSCFLEITVELLSVAAERGGKMNAWREKRKAGCNKFCVARGPWLASTPMSTLHGVSS